MQGYRIMNIAFKSTLVAAALSFASQAQAATYVLNLTGVVSSGTTATVNGFGYKFDFFSIALQGFAPLSLAVGDDVQANIVLDQSLTVPTASAGNFVRLFLINTTYPGTSTGTSGTTELFNANVSIVNSASGGGTSSAVVNSYFNPSGSSFTFDTVQSNFLVTSLSAPTLDVDYASLDYVLRTPLSAVPEPANWVMMLGGFALVGSAMRRRAKITVTYA